MCWLDMCSADHLSAYPMPLLKSISNALAYIRDAGDAMSKFEADPSTVSLPDPVWVLDEGGAPTWAEFLETMKVKAFDQY